MPFKYVIQRFTDGYTSDMNPAVLDMLASQDMVITRVSGATNMVFERGLIQTRTTTGQVGTVPAQINSAELVLAADSLPFVGSVGAVSANGAMCLTRTTVPLYHLYKLCTNFATAALFTPTEITGPGITGAGWNDFFFDRAVANGAVLIGGYLGGLIRWVPTTNVYTLIAAAPYSFVASHYSRAVGAFSTAGAVTSPITIGYSVPGDETDWAGVGSGSSVLTDIPDAITGVKTIRNTLVIARTFGFHLGMPTGTYPLVYNYTKFSDEAIGVAHPATFKVFGDKAYFLSHVGIHTFDTANIEDIGEGIQAEIFTLIQRWGATPRGFVTQSYKTDNQPCYNIILDIRDGPVGTPTALPHYMYNINEKKWSRHSYASSTSTHATLAFPFAYKMLSTFGTNYAPLPGLAVTQRETGVAPLFNKWSAQYNSEPTEIMSPAPFFTTGQLTISPAYMEAQLERILLVYSCTFTQFQSGQSPSFSVSINSMLNGIRTTTTPPNIVGNTGGSTYWQRTWGNVRVSGQMFEITITCPYQVQIKEMILEFSDNSKQRQ